MLFCIKGTVEPDFIITHLKNKHHAAGYIEAVLTEKDPESELLKLILSNVAEALSEEKMTPEQANLHREQLTEILFLPLNEAIYRLATWLDALGLKLTVTVAETSENHHSQTSDNLEIIA